jgi:hypothetical protein
VRFPYTSVDTIFIARERTWRYMPTENYGGTLGLLLFSSELLALVELLISLATSTKVALDGFQSVYLACTNIITFWRPRVSPYFILCFQPGYNVL